MSENASTVGSQVRTKRGPFFVDLKPLRPGLLQSNVCRESLMEAVLLRDGT